MTTIHPFIHYTPDKKGIKGIIVFCKNPNKNLLLNYIMPFTEEDFAKYSQQLSVIIMVRLRKHPLTPFSGLANGEKRKFNRVMNEYIQSLGEDWETKLITDFNQTCDEDLFTDSFKPEVLPVSQREGTKELLLTEEQLTFVDSVEHAKLMSNIV
jgi:hypothetical protein